MYQLTNTQLAQMSLFGQMAGMFGSAIGSYQSTRASQSNLRFQADMAEINAKTSETAAQAALDAGQKQIGSVTMRAGQIKSSQRAAMAANGIDLSTGSAAEVQASTDVMKEIDANTAQANAVRAAWGYRTQGINYQNDAAMRRSAASSMSPMGNTVTTLLGGATSVASNWYQMQKLGLFDNQQRSSASAGGWASNDFDGSGMRF